VMITQLSPILMLLQAMCSGLMNCSSARRLIDEY
jgi:hypothetical protein